MPRLGLRTLFVVALLVFFAGRAAAVPAFAVQTGQPCSSCHIGGFGPQLTPFGRDFKLRGYTARSNSFNVPLSAMAVGSFNHTHADQSAPPASHYGTNDNATLDQASLFVAGGLGSHLGAFVQTTYDGVARAFHWDNLDVRAVTTATAGNQKMVLGLSLNNAPTVQDAFNTLPAWAFPYTTSSLNPAPGAGPIIGSFAQNTLGLTAYAWINSSLYIEAGGYESPGSRFLTRLGVDPADPGSIRGIAPYGRVAFQKNYGTQNFEVGVFAMEANIYPGLDRSAGVADHYTDIGLDGSYQLFASKKNVVTMNGRYTYEIQRLDASSALGLSANGDQNLQDIRFDASYYWHNMVGFTAGAFDTFGNADALLYGSNRSAKPDSSGFLLQVDGTPYGEGKSPLGPRFNLRVGVQYTGYFTFDGARSDYDGFGRNASDNNTVRVFAWVAY